MPTRKYSADKKLAQISKGLERIRRALLDEYPAMPVGVHVHLNRDGSIDGELLVEAIPRGESAHRVLIKAQAGAKPIAGVWISVGARFTASGTMRPKEEGRSWAVVQGTDYQKNKGMLQVQVFYQRAHDFKRKGKKQKEHDRTAINFTTGRRIIGKISDKYGDKKPAQVFIRLHWNAENRKPGRGITRAGKIKPRDE